MSSIVGITDDASITAISINAHSVGFSVGLSYNIIIISMNNRQKKDS